MTSILTALTIQDKQLIMYGIMSVTALLLIALIVVLILKVMAAKADKKGEILPSLSELGIETAESEELPDFALEENDEIDISSFYEDEDELNVDSFLDRK